MEQLIKKWRERADRFDREAEARREATSMRLAESYEWEASRLRDCANELEQALGEAAVLDHTRLHPSTDRVQARALLGSWLAEDANTSDGSGADTEVGEAPVRTPRLSDQVQALDKIQRENAEVAAMWAGRAFKAEEALREVSTRVKSSECCSGEEWERTMEQLIAQWRKFACDFMDLGSIARRACADELEQALGEAPVRTPRPEWHQIETAPEGTMVLFCSMKTADVSKWCFVDWRAGGRFMLHPKWDATHWTVLPDPPAVGAPRPQPQTEKQNDGDYDGPTCGFALYGSPALCTCGTCRPQPQTAEQTPHGGTSDD